MSRLAQPRPSPSNKRDARTNGVDAQDEICPVCKSSRYLTPSLRFLINPECYHKMCESCVDRIFSHGPAACPIPGCRKTLRKARFRQQTFEDIQVEREVDIRKKVAAVFNKREDEFEDNRSYNDYLNKVEDITFNLIHNIDVAETNKRFEAYQKAHEKEILENASLEEQERLAFTQQKRLDREAAKERRSQARKEDEEERKEAESNRRDIISRLATAGTAEDAEQIAKEGQQVQLKKRMDRQAAAERQRILQAQSIRGLKAKTRRNEPDETPLDPFGGWRFQAKHYTLQDDYVWAGVQETKNDAVVSAGGYDVRDFTGRALCEAFAGLGVFVGDESVEMEVEKLTEGERRVGSVRAEVVGRDLGRK